MRNGDLDFVNRFQADKLLAAHLAERVFPPLDNPQFVKARDAGHVRLDDAIVGVTFRGKARAYPTWALDNYHIINDRWDGEPVVITA
ncbi:MAG: DUF3179 domain-containing protein [Acidobacteria bacterium]|nr:DUF3179 domain-containing protein [Acidobacteriota bacterium]